MSDCFFQDDGDLTVLGEIIAALPIDVRCAKLVVYGFIFGVLVSANLIPTVLSNSCLG